jgi:hypothetical protein
VKHYSVTQLAPSNAALSPTLLQAPHVVKDASRAAVGHALNDVQAAQAASLELLGPPHVQVLVRTGF